MPLLVIYLGAIIVLATLVAMASGRVPAVLALATAIAVAGVTGLTPPAELFAGLSNGGVITVAGMLVIAKGVVHTGVVTRVTWRLLAAVDSAGQAFRRLVVPVGVTSALINTTPIVAMLIPAVKELQQTRGVASRELLLPIAHATTLVGSVTLIGTSSNLLIASLASPAGVEMTMLSFAPVALPVALIGWVVLMVTAPRMLKGEAPSEERELQWRVEIPIAANANSIGRLPAVIGVESTQEYTLEAIQRWGRDLDPSLPIEAGDTLIYAATERGVRALWGSPRFGLTPQRLYMASVGSGEHGTLDDLEDQGDLRVVAAQTGKALRDTSAVPGETVFVTCGGPDVLKEHERLTVWQDVAGRAPQPGKTGIALAILLMVIIAASSSLLPVEMAAFAGAVLMVLAGVITPRSAVRALDWNVLFVLAGSIGLAAIVTSSGLSDLISQGVKYLVGDQAVLVVVVFALTTALLTNLVTNAAAASILTPIAIGIAVDLNLNPAMLLALIGTCISFTFINPFSHQTNMMVLKPGGYSNAVFARFGVPLILVSLVSVCAVGYVLIVP